MPIDPTIPLGVKPINTDFSGAIERGLTLRNLGTQQQLMQQQIAASKASQANTEAQLAGLQAESQQKQMMVAAQEWLGANIKNYERPDHSDTTQTPSTRYDWNKLTSDMSKAGLGYAVPSIMKDVVAQQSAEADLKGKNITNTQSLADAGIHQIQLQKTAAGFAAQFLRNLPPAEQQAAVKRLAPQLEQSAPGSTNLLFGQPDAQGNYQINPDKLEALSKASMNPLEEKQLGINQQLANLQVKVENGETLDAPTRLTLAKQAQEDSNDAATFTRGAAFLHANPDVLSQTWAEITKKYKNTPGYGDFVRAAQRYKELHGTELTISPNMVEVMNGEANSMAQRSQMGRKVANIPPGQGPANQPAVAPKNPPVEPSPTPTVKKEAPQSALDHLKKHPELASAFKAKYGYLPK